MFGRKSALIKHYEGEVDRLRDRVATLELANAKLVDRLLAKNGVPDIPAMTMPASPLGLDDMDVFKDMDEADVDNRSGVQYDGLVG